MWSDNGKAEGEIILMSQSESWKKPWKTIKNRFWLGCNQTLLSQIVFLAPFLSLNNNFFSLNICTIPGNSWFTQPYTAVPLLPLSAFFFTLECGVMVQKSEHLIKSSMYVTCSLVCRHCTRLICGVIIENGGKRRIYRAVGYCGVGGVNRFLIE